MKIHLSSLWLVILGIVLVSSRPSVAQSVTIKDRGFKIVVAANAPEPIRAAAKQVLDAANARNAPPLLGIMGEVHKPAELTDSAALLADKLPARAYSHLVMVGLPGDPIINATWQREARLETDGFYVFGWGHLRGDIGYIEGDRNPFLHSAAITSAPFETEIVTLSGNTPAGVALAVDAFLKKGLVNGVVAANGWTRPRTTLLDRDPLIPDFSTPVWLPPIAGDARLIGVIPGAEDEARGILEDTGVSPKQIWRAKYFLKGAWDGVGAAGAFDNYSFGLHRRAYGNTLWAASFNSPIEAQSAALRIAASAKLSKSGNSWSGNQPPYADGKYFGDKASAGPLRLWQRGEWIFMSTLPAAQTDVLISNPQFIAMKTSLLILLALTSQLAFAYAAPLKIEVPRSANAPKVDADLNDPAWKNAGVIPSLSLSIGPDANAKTPPPTQVRLLWDATYLYVRFECSDKEIYAPNLGGEAGRDANHFQGDVVEVFLDPVGDARQYIELQVSPKNGVFDALFLLTAPAESDADGVLKREIIERDSWTFTSWNIEGLRSATTNWKNGEGWTADVALPAAPLLKRLGLKDWQPQTIRANFLRYDWPLIDGKRSLTATNWSPIMWGRPHRSPQAMGFLELKP